MEFQSKELNTRKGHPSSPNQVLRANYLRMDLHIFVAPCLKIWEYVVRKYWNSAHTNMSTPDFVILKMCAHFAKIYGSIWTIHIEETFWYYVAKIRIFAKKMLQK